MNVDFVAKPHRSLVSFRVFTRCLQIFFVGILPAAGFQVSGAELRQGNAYSLAITDIDQRRHSTSEGRVTVVTVVTRKDEQKAQMVGDRYPRACLGDPRYRLITVVNFQQKILLPFRGIALEIIRYRLDSEARELQKTYAAKRVNRDARMDLFVAADFDGRIVSQLGIPARSAEFAVFVFDGRGHLVKRWNDVPSAEALSAAMNGAG